MQRHAFPAFLEELGTVPRRQPDRQSSTLPGPLSCTQMSCTQTWVRRIRKDGGCRLESLWLAG